MSNVEEPGQISWSTRSTCGPVRLELPLDGVSAYSMWNILNIVFYLTIYINGKAGNFGRGISGEAS